MRLVLVDLEGWKPLWSALRQAGLDPSAASHPRDLDQRPDLLVARADALDAGWIAALSAWQEDGTRLIAWGPIPRGLERARVSVWACFADRPVVEHLVAAVQGPRAADRIAIASGEVDLERSTVTLAGADGTLTPREVQLLRFLAGRPGQVVSREVLLDRVWGYAPDVVTRVVDATMHRLRAKIEVDPANPKHLSSVRGLGYRFVPATSEPTGERSTNIGPSLDPFFGRGETVAALAARFAAGARLVVLRGPGGIGKTRLAREVALALEDRWPGGAWFCDLSGCRTRTQGVTAVAEALGARLMSGGDGSAAAELGVVLEGRGRALLILDDVEHLAPLVGDLVAAWLAAAPELTLLLTSQAPLELPGEQVVEVPALEMEDAVALLRERVRAAGARIGPEDARSVAELLEGSPLALELAAGMVDLLGPRALIDRLGVSLGQLEAPAPGRPVRHRSLRAAVGHAWDRLSAEEREALTQCCVFRGPFTAAEAEACLARSDAGLSELRSLRARSLLSRGDGPRLRVLGSVSEFTREQAGEAAVLLAGERLHDWVVEEAASRCEPGTIASSDTVRWLARRRGDLLAAFEASLERDRIDDAAALAGGLYQVLALQGPVDGALDVVDRVLARWGADDSTRLRLLLARVAVLRLLGRRESIEQAVAEGVDLAEACGDVGAEGRFLANLGAAQLGQGDSADAVPVLEQASELARQAGDDISLGVVLGNLASAYWDCERATDAEHTHAVGMEHCRQVGHQRLVAFALSARGNFECETGRPAGAERIREALEIHSAAGDPLNRSFALERLAEAWLVDPDRAGDAVAELERAAELRRSRGEVRLEPVFLHTLGAAQVAVGRFDEAHVSFSMALADPRLGRAELHTFLEIAVRLCRLLRGLSDPGGPELAESLEPGRARRLHDVLLAERARLAGDLAGAWEFLERATGPTADGWKCEYADVAPFVRAVEGRCRSSG